MVGAESPEQFASKLEAFHVEHQNLLTTMADKPDFSALEKRIADLESRPLITEARISEMLKASVSASIETFAASDAGKKIIGAEASRVASTALASVGTQPVKPAPVAAEETPEQRLAALTQAGKHEDAYAQSPALQREFLSAKQYAAFMRANARGQVRVAQSAADFKRN